MAYEHSIRRYRHWYATLLRLYPKPYFDRFGEGIEQTFNDLLRERAERSGGLFAYALWMFVETSGGIIKEYITIIAMPLKNVIRVALITAAILMVPLLLMVFDVSVPDPGSSTRDGVNWTPSDFAVMGTLLFVTGLSLDFVLRSAGKYRVAAAIVIIAAFFWLWAELAVGVFTNWGS